MRHTSDCMHKKELLSGLLFSIMFSLYSIDRFLKEDLIGFNTLGLVSSIVHKLILIKTWT